MKFRNQAIKYYLRAPTGGEGGGAGAGGADGGGGAGTGGGEEGKPTVEMAALEKELAGLRAENADLQGSLKTQAEQLARFDGIDPDAVRNILQKFANDKEAALIAKGDLDTVLEMRTARMQESHDKELEELKKEITRRDDQLARAERKEFRGEVAATAKRYGAIDEASEDIMRRAMDVFKLDERGDLVAKDGSLDSKGKPLTVDSWFAELKDKAPWFFPAKGGSGTAGGAHGAGMKRSEMSAAQMREYIAKHGQQAYLKLPL